MHHLGVPPFREALRAPSPRGLHDPCGPRTAELCKGLQGLAPEVALALRPAVSSCVFRSRAIVDPGLPQRVSFDHRIQDDEELAHGCRERHFLCFPARQ